MRRIAPSLIALTIAAAALVGPARPADASREGSRCYPVSGPNIPQTHHERCYFGRSTAVDCEGHYVVAGVVGWGTTWCSFADQTPVPARYRVWAEATGVEPRVTIYLGVPTEHPGLGDLVPGCTAVSEPGATEVSCEAEIVIDAAGRLPAGVDCIAWLHNDSFVQDTRYGCEAIG